MIASLNGEWQTCKGVVSESTSLPLKCILNCSRSCFMVGADGFVAAGHVLSDPLLRMSYFPLNDLRIYSSERVEIRSYRINWTMCGFMGDMGSCPPPPQSLVGCRPNWTSGMKILWCWLHVENCIFEHMTDRFFRWPPPLFGDPCPNFLQGCPHLGEITAVRRTTVSMQCR